MANGPAASHGGAAGGVAAEDGAIASVVLQSARGMAFWLAILFAIFIVTDRVLFAAPANVVLPVFDALLAAGFLAYWLAARAGLVSPRHAGTAAAGILLACLPYLLTVLAISGQPLQSTGLALWHVGCGLFLLSWRWLLSLLVVSDVAWVVVVLRLPPSDEWPHFATLLLSANLLAVLAHEVRLSTYRRIEALRRADQQRQRELEEALAEARQVDEVRRLSELKTRFMNVAAHELATPMTPILIQIRLLRDLHDRLPPEARRPVAVLDRNLTRMQQLLRDILDGTRLQAQKLPLTLAPLDLRPVLQDAVDGYAHLAQERGVGLHLDAQSRLPVVGDPDRLTQVATNLLSNALKFTPRGGTVRVTAAVEGPLVRVQVADTGAGFQPEAAAQLFQPFSQLHDDDARRQGTGLGLYICKGIVDRHGGSIGASSAGIGQGAAFWFTLPRA